MSQWTLPTVDRLSLLQLGLGGEGAWDPGKGYGDQGAIGGGQGTSMVRARRGARHAHGAVS